MARTGFLTLLAFLLALSACWNLWILYAAQESASTQRMKRSRLYDLEDFSYLKEPLECSNTTLLGILLVTSHFEQRTLRMAHRMGYPDEDIAQLGIRRIFLLATPPQGGDSAQQGEIHDEARQFQDILQGNFVDAYRNLTYKNTMGLMWAAEKCSTATFTIKQDDDIALNIYELANILRKELTDPKSYQRLGGMPLLGSGPIRDPNSKWFLTKAEFPDDTFPDYLSGWMFFGRTKVLGEIANNASATMPYIFIDDMFLLGMARKKFLGDPPNFLDLGDLFTFRLHCCMENLHVTCPFMVGPSLGNAIALFRFVRQARKCLSQKACLPPPKRSDGCKSESKCFCSTN